MLRSMLGVLAPELATRLREAMLHLHQASTVGIKEVRQAAEQTRPLLTEARKAVLGRGISAQDLRAMIETLVSEGVRGNYNDYGAAEQAAMALASLAGTLRLSGGLSAAQTGQLDNSLKDIDGVLKNENAYEPERLVSALQTISATLKQ